MPRQLRHCVPEAIYHVIARGTARQPIFLDDQDRATFLTTLRHVVATLEWRCLSYVLMGNHYHLVVKMTNKNLSEGMRLLNGFYAQRFNLKHDRTGHLFQGRFSSKHVDTDPYLTNLLCYVALNPVRAGLCNTATDWPWSAHRALLLKRTDELIAVKETLSYINRDLDQARQTYHDMVLVQMTSPQPSTNPQKRVRPL